MPSILSFSQFSMASPSASKRKSTSQRLNLKSTPKNERKKVYSKCIYTDIATHLNEANFGPLICRPLFCIACLEKGEKLTADGKRDFLRLKKSASLSIVLSRSWNSDAFLKAGGFLCGRMWRRHSSFFQAYFQRGSFICGWIGGSSRAGLEKNHMQSYFLGWILNGLYQTGTFTYHKNIWALLLKMKLFGCQMSLHFVSYLALRTKLTFRNIVTSFAFEENPSKIPYFTFAGESSVLWCTLQVPWVFQAILTSEKKTSSNRCFPTCGEMLPFSSKYLCDIWHKDGATKLKKFRVSLITSTQSYILHEVHRTGLTSTHDYLIKQSPFQRTGVLSKTTEWIESQFSSTWHLINHYIKRHFPRFSNSHISGV